MTDKNGVVVAKVISHRLDVSKRLTDVEELAERIEGRRDNRIRIPFGVRKRLLSECRAVAKKLGRKSTIPLEELVKLRDQAKKEVKGNNSKGVAEIAGIPHEGKLYLHVLERAVNRVTNELNHNDFYFQDFSFYHTRLMSSIPLLNSPMFVSVSIMAAFYLLTPVFFCLVIEDDNVCPREEDEYKGWMTALYFASTTMSTVGYGDISVYGGEETPRWRVLVGIIYMILSMVMLVTAFSALSGDVASPIDGLQNFLIRMLSGGGGKDQLLYQRTRIVKYTKLFIILLEFFCLNVIGVLVSRLFIDQSEVEGEQWSWMTSLYWSVQTTTTIGYGDLDMPFDMRWFQIFYLVVSTYFVGDALGRLGSLKAEITAMRRQYAWSRREVSKGMLEDMQAKEHDGVIDQYEYVVASLLSLHKITGDDITPIMQKYRQLAGEDGIISIEDIKSRDEDDSNDDDQDDV